MKEALLTAIGVVGGALSWAFGGWSGTLLTLVICMGADYITGLIVAGVFKKSKKSNGALDSYAGFKGLVRKGVMLLIVMLGAQLDRVMGTTFVRDAVITAFIANEALSIVENAGLMGIPIPKVITRAIEALKGKDEEETAAENATHENPENTNDDNDIDVG